MYDSPVGGICCYLKSHRIDKYSIIQLRRRWEIVIALIEEFKLQCNLEDAVYFFSLFDRSCIFKHLISFLISAFAFNVRFFLSIKQKIQFRSKSYIRNPVRIVFESSLNLCPGRSRAFRDLPTETPKSFHL